MIMNIDFKVSVRCMTYNQAAYIEDAMNGFCMQQTDFPFVCNVMDDASTDGEQEIIYKYLDSHFDLEENNLIKKEETDDYKLIFARHKENKNCYFAVFFLKYNHYNNQRLTTKKLQYLSKWENNAKYIALCEGDDFWIDKCKLQKQYDSLENNSDYSFVYTGFYIVNQNGTIQHEVEIEDRMKKSHSGILFFDLLVNMNHIMTMTTFFRSRALKDLQSFYYDYGIFLTAARQGLACYLPERTSCYRINPTSIMNTAPNILLPKMYKIVNIEVNRCLGCNTTSSIIKDHCVCRKVLAYICVRYINKSTCRLAYLQTLLKHPSLWIYAIESVIIRVFWDEKFRISLKKL